MDHLKDALRQMLLEFQERLAPKDADDFKPASRRELRQVISSIQKQQENEKRMMDMTRLKSFLDAMDQFGEIVNMSLQDSEFVGFIWGSMKFLLKVRRGFDYVEACWWCMGLSIGGFGSDGERGTF